MKRLSGVCAALSIALLAGACTTPQDPAALDGRIVLRIEQGNHANAALRPAPNAPLDSVIVRVFRPGNPPVQEVFKGAGIGIEPVELSLGCIAESGKRVSVELFALGVMTHHGFDTDVAVTPNTRTDVQVDAYPFLVDSVDVKPAVVQSGESFGLEWSSARAATGYLVQASATANFASIAWTQSVDDTVLDVADDPGSHYFRVVPKTLFASGTPTRARFGYVTSGSTQPKITGFGAPAVIPLETVSILGENLDYPGTTVMIGPRQCTVLSSSWGRIDVRVPRAALTNLVTVSSTLGSAFSSTALVIQRVAFVTLTGEHATAYGALLSGHGDDFGYSGVVAIPVTDLDTRDMSVFDIIMVAGDTGLNKVTWAGDPTRVNAIVASGAGVVAIGDGGATFMKLALTGLATATTVASNVTDYFTSVPNSTVFRSPHVITDNLGLPQQFKVCQSARRAVAFDIDSAPAGGTLYAATTGLFTNQRWSMLDVVVNDSFGTRRFFFWGYGGDPADLTALGGDCVGNIMALLYQERPVSPVAASR